MTVFGIPIIKWIEAWQSAYLGSVGLLFLLYPQSLESAVYAPWRELGPVFWGCVLVFNASLHIGALWLNGRARYCSRMVRAVACGLHLYLIIMFSIFFIEGHAIWGALTFLFFVAPMLIPVFMRVVTETRIAYHDI